MFLRPLTMGAAIITAIGLVPSGIPAASADSPITVVDKVVRNTMLYTSPNPAADPNDPSIPTVVGYPSDCFFAAMPDGHVYSVVLGRETWGTKVVWDTYEDFLRDTSATQAAFNEALDLDFNEGRVRVELLGTTTDGHYDVRYDVELAYDGLPAQIVDNVGEPYALPMMVEEVLTNGRWTGSLRWQFTLSHVSQDVYDALLANPLPVPKDQVADEYLMFIAHGSGTWLKDGSASPARFSVLQRGYSRNGASGGPLGPDGDGWPVEKITIRSDPSGQ